ncbi:MAG: hypothetical protein AAGB14_12025 [Verrucomicrobiota bacterium]
MRYFVALATTGLSEAAVIWDESVDGDFSGDYLNPTPIVLSTGDNLISGTVRGGPLDQDLFTLTVPVGQTLNEVRVTEYSGITDALSFMGAQPGTQLSDPPGAYIFDDPSVGPINYVLYGQADADIDRDVMPQLVVGAPMSGQSPLPAGDYTFWINETQAQTGYTFNFVVVPEPGSLALGLVSLLFFGRRTVRR